MHRIIFLLIAIGLLWNSQSVIVSAFEEESESVAVSFLEEELSEERADSENEENQIEKLEFLATNQISKKLLTYKPKKELNETPTLLSFISPVFTPPPNIS